ncbi:AbrB family transcriptional regulator [Xenorhabdus sp. IM139775]|uniref:AbrB family transcriptional regulator n=1 Tax=Xenorhabdus sp. IM139775 TaxID=3025876 RepID=UPI00235943A7|nr:AbrB family transcriptional regulator [Xenorhabdus sp. IM139775]MDC9594432.1 AbrB family transcriptional regulator [Xenorhabdus sp. IM139775]
MVIYVSGEAAKNLDLEEDNELGIIREEETIILRPVRPDWDSFLYEDKADTEFLYERQDIIEEGRVIL